MGRIAITNPLPYLGRQLGIKQFPLRTQDEMSPTVDALEDVVIYHYDRREEIYSGVTEFIEDKIRMKALFYGLTSYAKRHPAKFAGRVITRGVPYVGWALLAYDAIELYRWYQD